MSEVSEETTYYIRTSLMFKDLTREVLIKVFKFLIKSEDITDFLSSLEQQNILRELLKKDVINKFDYNLVSGQVLNLEKFDISLLVRLILNLCKDNIPQPQRGWETQLHPKDESLGADLLRLRYVRNNLIAHRADAKLTEAEYEKTWAKIKAILMRVVELVDSESRKNFERRINEYKRLNVDIENAEVKRLLDELLNYKIEFDHLQEKVEELSRRSKEFQEYFKITPEIFVRYIKLLFDGGRIVLCGIMMTKLGDQDLSDFLEGKKETLIRNIDEKYSRCLYSQESCSDYKTWDVYLLASILLLTFDNDLSQKEIMYIERIKSAMVNYAALAFRSLDAVDFLTNWTDLIICLKDLSSNIAEDDKLQIENLIERYKNKDEGGCDAEEYFKQLKESGVEVKTLNDIYNETIEELRDMLNEMSQKDIKFEKGYVFEFKLLTICENEEINKIAEDTLEINLQASIQKSDQPSGDIRRETDKAVDIIAAHPDVTPLEIKRKCIIWSFNCSTPVGLLHILDVTQGDQFRNTFRNIAYEMHYIYGYAFIIQGKCTFESVSMVSRMINKSTSYEASREQISIPLKCSSVEGISSVLSVIKQGKTTNILNRIAEQMSADFNETVSIKLTPDLMEFRNVFEETDSDRSSSLGRNEFETEELVPVEIDKTDKHADDERKEVSARQQLYDEKMNEYAIENKGQEGNSQTITDKFQTIDHGQVILVRDKRLIKQHLHMASIGNDRYLRYHLLVGQGGTITLRGILIRDIGSPLPQVLFHSRAKLNMKKKELDRIFNSENSITDINTWDIAILSKIILQLCRGKTPADELNYVRIIKSLRNELFHPGSLEINDEKEYVEQWKHAGCTLTKLCKNLDRSIRDECQNLIENCKSGLINRQETLHMLGSISQYDNKISEQLAILTRRVEELTEQVIIIMKEIEDLRQEVEQYILSGRDAKCRTMAVLESRLTIRGDNTQLTELAEEILERVFRRASKRTQVPEDETQLISEVRQFLDEMEAHEGVYVCGIKKECIQVKIVFENFKGLLKLLEYFQSNEFRNRLHGLIKAMEEMNDSQYQITFEIDKDNVDSITKSMAKATNDEIPIADEKLIELRTINANERRLETDETMLKQASDRPDVIGGNSDSSETELSPSASDRPDVIGGNSDSSETELSPSETPGCDEESGLQRENEALLDGIVELADSIGDEDHVILLIGQIGAGKSSLINTLHKILTDRYFIVAPQGRGMTQSVTTELIRYDKCGATLNFLERIPNENKKQKMKKIFKKLPHIIDFPGFVNHNTPELTEILELLIGGYIPTGTTIQALENIQKFGIGALKGVFPDANPKLQVSKIFFLTSFTDAFPEKLIQCLNGVLTNYQSAGPYLKRKPDLYILATKYDLVLDQNLRSEDTSDESNKILEEFLKVEERLSSELKRSGRSFRWISFHDGINVNSTSVENMVLKVLKCIFEPGAPVLKYNKKVIGIRVRAKLGANRVKQCLQKFLTEDVHIEVTRAMFLVGVACMVAVVLALWFIK